MDVNHIAKLARLGLSEDEEQKFEKELSAILDFVGKLNEAKTDDIEPIAQITGLSDVVRKDETNDLSADTQVKEGILNNAPQREGRFFKVRRVLE
ncbi:MAG: Asp-tRNA(Asn)/Glu-tRNA(Gln) amidotransferase subunit GatC [Candidatus Portnoybacteria bacterium]|nr:Asp-tRNA(Asn)/Glu-tRNA(Gln) amidotransferase subunit GatC [Candidatus Portnoybacteria bacterium]